MLDTFGRSYNCLKCIVETFDLADLLIFLAVELYILEVVDGEFADDSVFFKGILFGHH